MSAVYGGPFIGCVRPNTCTAFITTPTDASDSHAEREDAPKPDQTGGGGHPHQHRLSLIVSMVPGEQHSCARRHSSSTCRIRSSSASTVHTANTRSANTISTVNVSPSSSIHGCSDHQCVPPISGGSLVLGRWSVSRPHDALRHPSCAAQLLCPCRHLPRLFPASISEPMVHCDCNDRPEVPTGQPTERDGVGAS